MIKNTSQTAGKNQPFWHCPNCGGNFSWGEKCDCQYQPKQNITRKELSAMSKDIKKIKELFNVKKLTIEDAIWYGDRGYEVICHDGRVAEVKPPAGLKGTCTA